VTWPSESWIRSGNGSVVAWARLQGTHSGNNLTGTLSDCGRTDPGFASIALSERYDLTYPSPLFDHEPAYLQSVSASVTLGSAAPSASFALARVAFLSGLSMNDPQNGSWPTASSGVTQVDMDADGQPGVTALYNTASGNMRPPASTTNLTRRSDTPYVAARMVFALGGTLTSCTQASGSASVTQVNTRIVGCHIANASNCSPSDTTFYDSNHPQYSAGSASYSLVKVADNATCAAIRAALP
jgi:hypothetical protein